MGQNIFVTSILGTCAFTRARSFALFSGLFYIGVSLGPALGSMALQKTSMPTMGLFYIAVAANSLNLFFIPFLLPESLPPAPDSTLSTHSLREDAHSGSTPLVAAKPSSIWRRFFIGTFGFMGPLRVLLPKRNQLNDSVIQRSVWDIDLTLLGVASFCAFLLNVNSPVHIF